jgi:hypothetical protein
MVGGLGNVDGHWESNAIADFNDELLTSAGTRWDDWLPFNGGWYDSPVRADYERRGAEVLRQEFGDASLFVVKDPRTCRIAPFWFNVLEAEGIEPAIVVIVRNPLEVAASLQARDGIEPGYGHLLWLRHILDAEAATRGRKRFFCSYDQLMMSWRIVATKIQTQLGLSWPRFSVAVEEDISRFLNKERRHHEVPVEAVVGDPALSSWLRGTFEVMLRWAQDGENPADYDDLDAVRVSFNETVPVFGYVVLEAARSRARFDEQQREVEARELAHLQAHDAWVAERDSLQSTLATLHVESESHHHQLINLESTLRQREEEALQAGLCVKAEQEVNRELRSDLERQVARLKEKSTELSSCLAEMAVLTQDVSEVKLELKSLVIDKDLAEARLAERFSEIAALSQLLKQQERRNAEQAAQADWLRNVTEALWKLPRWWGVMPRSWQQAMKYRRLRRRELFDAESYLARYPDVARDGGDPLRHYIRHGMVEGRII